LVDALICYKQKCKVASFNLAHPVYTKAVARLPLRYLGFLVVLATKSTVVHR